MKPMRGPFRTGGRVPLNVYEGDRPIFQAHTPEDAERLVSLLNAGASAPKPVIVADGEHTPGPWTFRSGVDLEVQTKRGVEMLQTPAHVVKVDQDGEGRKRTMFICDCAGVGLPNEANARLIAAAPETAAELERAKKELIRWRALGAETPEGLRDVIEYAGQVKKTITDPELARLRAELERVKADSARMQSVLKTMKEYEAAQGPADDGVTFIGLAHAGVGFGPAIGPHYDPYELAEKIAEWLHDKCDEGLTGTNPYWDNAFQERDQLRAANRDLSTILADLREWMSVAGMAVEKDVDMLFVLKGRFDALGASNRDLVGALSALFALVRGEVPSLLENDHHYELVVNALARAKASR